MTNVGHLYQSHGSHEGLHPKTLTRNNPPRPQKIGNHPESYVVPRLHPCGTFGAFVSDLQVGQPGPGGRLGGSPWGSWILDLWLLGFA